MPWSDFTPTGLYLPPHAALTLNVEPLAGDTLPTLLIGTYSRLAQKGDPQEMPLTAGENIVTADAFGGLLFLRFVTDSTPASVAQVTFLQGYTLAPTFILGETSQSAWQTQLDTLTDSPDVIMVSQRTMMVFSRQHALQWRDEDVEAVLRTADTILEIEGSISGFDPSDPLHQPPIHPILLTETNDEAYMYATFYRTAYETSAAEYAFTSLLGSADGWGPWHELGHTHQQAAWTWYAVDEVTVNIYTLAVQRGLGYAPSRLTAENVWAGMDAFFALPDQDFNDDAQLDVFVRLCMFEQLRLAYGDAFYAELHRQTRAEQPYFENDQDKMAYFMLKAAGIAGEDLTTFFRQWGFQGVEAAFAELQAMNLPLPQVEPSTLREE